MRVDSKGVAELSWLATPAHMAFHLSNIDYQPSPDDTDDLEPAETPERAYELYEHTKLLAKAFRDAALLPNQRIIAEVGPRYGKSLLMSIWGPAWYLNLFPDKRVILASYGHDLALHDARSCRNIMRGYPEWITSRLAPDASRADQWNIQGHRGGLKAAGVGGALTGFGASLALVDDPLRDWADAQSANQREKVWDWFRSVLLTRLHKGGSCIILNTRWHRDDLSGRLIAEDNKRELEGKPRLWKVIRLPTIADAEARGEVDPLGREDGEVLCPDLFPPEQVLAQREELGSIIFGAMHQQDPTDPEGSIFKREWWMRFDGRPEPQTLFGWTISIDTSFKDTTKSDLVVMQVWARDNYSNHFLLDQIKGRWSFVRTKAELVALWQRWPMTTRVLIEDKANGPAVISELSGTVPGIIAVTPLGSKESRAHAVSPMVSSGHVWIPSDTLAPWSAAYVDELGDFPGDTHDDQVDATTQYLNATGGGPLATRMASYGYSATKR